MRAEFYKGYTIRGFASSIGNGRFVASGGVDKNSCRVDESGEIGCYLSLEEAAAEGLSWAKDWVDAHPQDFEYQGI